jgi:hypothetical protein
VHRFLNRLNNIILVLAAIIRKATRRATTTPRKLSTRRTGTPAMPAIGTAPEEDEEAFDNKFGETSIRGDEEHKKLSTTPEATTRHDAGRHSRT